MTAHVDSFSISLNRIRFPMHVQTVCLSVSVSNTYNSSIIKFYNYLPESTTKNKTFVLSTSHFSKASGSNNQHQILISQNNNHTTI